MLAVFSHIHSSSFSSLLVVILSAFRPSFPFFFSSLPFFLLLSCIPSSLVLFTGYLLTVITVVLLLLPASTRVCLSVCVFIFRGIISFFEIISVNTTGQLLFFIVFRFCYDSSDSFLPPLCCMSLFLLFSSFVAAFSLL